MAQGRSKKAEAQKGGPERAQGRPTREGEGPGGGKGAKEGWGSGISRPYKTVHVADNCCCYFFVELLHWFLQLSHPSCELRDGPGVRGDQWFVESAPKQVGPTIPSVWLILSAAIGVLSCIGCETAASIL